MPVDLEAVRARIAELRADDKKMSEAPWTQRPWPEFGVDGPTYPICTITSDDDRRPLVDEDKAKCDSEDVVGIARTRNSLASTAEMLETMVGEVERLRAEPVNLFDRLGADRLADEVAVLVRRKIIDARSPAGDALLDYRDPPPSERSDRLWHLEAEVARLTAENDALRSVNENSAGVIAGLRRTCERMTVSQTDTTNAYEERLLELEADNVTHEARLRDLNAINALMVNEINHGRLDPHMSEPLFVERLLSVVWAAQSWNRMRSTGDRGAEDTRAQALSDAVDLQCKVQR